MKNKIKEWIELAKIDLKAAQTLSRDEYLSPAAAFHAHQCVEKMFKAVIESQNISVPKAHDLIRLHQIVKNSTDFSCDEDILYDLSRIYIDSRYPAMQGQMPYGRPEISDAVEYIRFAEELFSSILQILNN